MNKCKLCGRFENFGLLEKNPIGICVCCYWDTDIPEHIDKKQETLYFEMLVKKRRYYG